MLSSEPESTGEAIERTEAAVQAEVDHELGEDAPVAELLSGGAPHNPYEVLHIPDFRNYLIGGVFAAAGSQMTNVAAGWELYNRTNSPFALGLLGLMSAIPVISLALPAGSLADRVSRKKLAAWGQGATAVTLFALAVVSRTHAPLVFFYACILLNGLWGALTGPAMTALAYGLVPTDKVAESTKWMTLRWQLAATFGPVLGGVLVYRIHEAPVYTLDGLGRLVFCVLLLGLNPRQQPKSKEKMNWGSVAAGARFVFEQPLILSTITLDMIAVLFGGATALLPVYARDILHVGAQGLGPMRAAPAIGSMCMALFLTHTPPLRRAGVTLLWAVFGFGLATIVFGLSHNYAVSLVALFVLGAFDNISVVVRHTLLQILTPDEMRGRVSAVNSVFIGTSNEIGEVESGTVAQWFGPIISVVSGGVLTLVTVIAVALLWPAVRRLGSIEDAKLAQSG